MATLNKKLKIKSGSSTQSCNLYTTTIEAGSDNLKLKVDNQNVYASLTTTSDSQASKGRIKKSGTTKAIAVSGKPPYTEKSWTTAGTYTFTVPAGVTRIRVAVCGGGGGASVALDAYDTDGEPVTASASAGGTSSFGSVSATGGGGGYSSVDAWERQGNKGTSKGGTYKGHAGTAGSPNGHVGIYNTSGGTYSYGYRYGHNLSFSDTASESNTNYGAGGGGNRNDQDGTRQDIATGGSGGFNSTYLNVTTGSSYSVKVGAGGSAADNSYKSTVTNGKSGFVLIAYGGDI